MKVLRIFAVLMVLAFIGCVSRGVLVGPGNQPDSVPPKIVMGPNNSMIWDRPTAFGPIPAQLQENGKKVCGPLGLEAIGYHPKAQDANGKEFPEGGYLCVPK